MFKHLIFYKNLCRLQPEQTAGGIFYGVHTLLKASAFFANLTIF